MLARTLGFIMLLLIMLNHAVIACDSLVIHLPEHNHAFSSPLEHHSSNELDDAEHHTEHAHVTCHIAFFCGIDLLNFNDTAISRNKDRLILISYSPPVPPPNF